MLGGALLVIVGIEVLIIISYILIVYNSKRLVLSSRGYVLGVLLIYISCA